jgi:hypothetical protein
VLGAFELPIEESVCELPVSVQVERLRHELAARSIDGVSVRIEDLYGLEGDERDAALDAVVAGEPSPLVFVHGRLVCSGAVEPLAILAALGSGLAASR